MSNTGERDGDEVVQLYVRDPVASVTRPVLELKGFARVSVPAGESRSVRFEVPIGQIGFYDRGLRYVVEPGDIQLFVGTSSESLIDAGTVSYHLRACRADEGVRRLGDDRGLTSADGARLTHRVPATAESTQF